MKLLQEPASTHIPELEEELVGVRFILVLIWLDVPMGIDQHLVKKMQFFFFESP